MPETDPLRARIQLTGADRAARQLRTFSASSLDAEKALRGAGAAVGILSAAMIAKGVAAASAFESEMTKVETLVGLSREQVQGFSRDLLELGPALGRSPQELSRALFVVTSAGERGAEALEVVEAAGKAAAVGLGDTTEIARAVTAAMQAYGDQGLNAARATDIMTATVREGNLEASALAGSLGRVIGIASQVGVSFAEAGAFIATFTRLGVSAEEAVTSLRAILNTALKPTSEAQEALQEMGLSADFLRETIEEDGLLAALQVLGERADGDSAALAAVIPNVRALAGVMGTAGAQGEQFAEILTNIEESAGIVDEGMERTRENLSQQMAEIRAEFEATAIQIGDEFLPVVKNFAEGIGALGGAFELLPSQMQGALLSLGVLAGLLAVGGPLVAGIGAVIGALGLATTFVDDMKASADEAAPSVEQLKEQVEGLAGAFQDMDRADVQSVAAGLGGRLQNVQAQIAETRAAIEEAEQEIAEAGRADRGRTGGRLGLAARQSPEMQEAQARLSELRNQLSDLEEQEEGLAEAVGKASEALSTFGEEAEEAEESTGGLSTGTGEAGEEAEEAVREIENLIVALTEQHIELAEGERALLEYQLRSMDATDAERQRALALFDAIEALRAKEAAEREARRELERHAEAERRFHEQVAEDAEKAVRRVVDSGGRLAELVAMQEQIRRTSESMAASVVDAFEDIASGTENVVDAVRKMVSDILREFARLAAQQAITGPLTKAFAKLLGGALGGGIPDAPGPIDVGEPTIDTSAFEGFQHGGRFKVRGIGGADSQLVAFRATPGEQVTVTPQGQQQAPAEVHHHQHNITINAVDAASVRELLRRNRGTVAQITAEAFGEA